MTAREWGHLHSGCPGGSEVKNWKGDVTGHDLHSPACDKLTAATEARDQEHDEKRHAERVRLLEGTQVALTQLGQARIDLNRVTDLGAAAVARHLTAQSVADEWRDLLREAIELMPVYAHGDDCDGQSHSRCRARAQKQRDAFREKWLYRARG